MLSFFNKTSPKATGTRAPSNTPAPPPDDDKALSKETGIVLDALGAILQHYGAQAFDVEERSADAIRKRVHDWKMHATVGAARPDHDTDKASAGIFYRDWKGLVTYFGEQRREESNYVTRVMEDFRAVTWAFVKAVHQVVVDEKEESRIAKDQLGRMRQAAEGNSTDLMRREALAVAGAMEQLIEQRREKQQVQFAVLADRLKSLGRELEDARRESTLDGLTGLSNRKAFDEYIARSIELHTLLGQPACLVLVDVDKFKEINDTYGHVVGDAALKHVAHSLSRTFLRRVDFVCRYGGDEFAVILQECALDNAHKLAERLRGTLAGLAPVEVSERMEPPVIQLSIGVAELEGVNTPTAWIERADAALYQAKRNGRNQVALFAPETPATPAQPATAV